MRIKPNTDGRKPDIILYTGRRLRHLPACDARQYRMSGIRALPDGAFAVIDLDYSTAESRHGNAAVFPSLVDAIAWADYLADRFSAEFFDTPEPIRPSVEPYESLASTRPHRHHESRGATIIASR
jgi:hypothetical protein